MASLEVHISELSGMWQQVRHTIDSGCRNFVARLQEFHNLYLHCRSVLVTYRKLTAREGSVGLPPRGFTATPAGGSKSGWHQ